MEVTICDIFCYSTEFDLKLIGDIFKNSYKSDESIFKLSGVNLHLYREIDKSFKFKADTECDGLIEDLHKDNKKVGAFLDENGYIIAFVGYKLKATYKSGL